MPALIEAAKAGPAERTAELCALSKCRQARNGGDQWAASSGHRSRPDDARLRPAGVITGQRSAAAVQTQASVVDLRVPPGTQWLRACPRRAIRTTTARCHDMAQGQHVTLSLRMRHGRARPHGILAGPGKNCVRWAMHVLFLCLSSSSLFRRGHAPRLSGQNRCATRAATASNHVGG